MQVRPPHDAPTLAQWRMVSILCLVNAIAFIDRTALPLLVQPIKRDLGISDTLMSFLIGAAFIITYAFGGSLIGVLVDRYPRRRILATGIAAWGAATIFCGSVLNYAALFAGRCGVGAGEATCGPVSMSLIKDSFEPRFRGRAVAIWAMGASLGGGFALLAGGAILHLVGESGTVVLLLFPFPEPARRSLATEQAVSLQEAFTSVRDRWTIFVPLFLANAATIMLSVSYSSWVPAFLGRTWKIPAGEIGLIFGLIVLFLSTASQFTIGTSTIVHLSPGAAIGKITGVHFAWVGITGSAVAPTLIAVLAEQVFGGGQQALGHALSGAGGTLSTIGGLSLLVVSWQLRRGDAG